MKSSHSFIDLVRLWPLTRQRAFSRKLEAPLTLVRVILSLPYDVARR